jgi:hypothetical protein
MLLPLRPERVGDLLRSIAAGEGWAQGDKN